MHNRSNLKVNKILNAGAIRVRRKIHLPHLSFIIKQWKRDTSLQNVIPSIGHTALFGEEYVSHYLLSFIAVICGFEWIVYRASIKCDDLIWKPLVVASNINSGLVITSGCLISCSREFFADGPRVLIDKRKYCQWVSGVTLRQIVVVDVVIECFQCK